MSVKGQVGIRSVDDSLEEFASTWKTVEQGRRVKGRSGTYFTSLDAARKVLTTRRLELMRAIRRERPGSIYQLAHLVRRDFKNVHRDLQTLAEHGLVSLRKSKGVSGRDITTPTVPFKEIEFRVAV